MKNGKAPASEKSHQTAGPAALDGPVPSSLPRAAAEAACAARQGGGNCQKKEIDGGSPPPLRRGEQSYGGKQPAQGGGACEYRFLEIALDVKVLRLLLGGFQEIQGEADVLGLQGLDGVC